MQRVIGESFNRASYLFRKRHKEASQITWIFVETFKKEKENSSFIACFTCLFRNVASSAKIDCLEHCCLVVKPSEIGIILSHFLLSIPIDFTTETTENFQKHVTLTCSHKHFFSFCSCYGIRQAWSTN